TQTDTSSANPGPAVIVGHLTWQGPPAQPSSRQALPISMTLYLQSGGTPIEFSGMSTEPSGVFTVTADVTSGNYYWRTKGPKYLATSGSVALARGLTTNVEMGLMRAGDCNDDNKVTAIDFNILRISFGRSLGDPGYDDRADFTGDEVVNAADFNLLKRNFGLFGPPPPGP